MPGIPCRHYVKSIKGVLKKGGEGINQTEIAMKDKTFKVPSKDRVNKEEIINSAGYAEQNG